MNDQQPLHGHSSHTLQVVLRCETAALLQLFWRQWLRMMMMVASHLQVLAASKLLFTSTERMCVLPSFFTSSTSNDNRITCTTTASTTIITITSGSLGIDHSEQELAALCHSQFSLGASKLAIIFLHLCSMKFNFPFAH
jgi:hypothetical protein